jgi:deazaflavin-dependent oxidoreductase (nitroreductase family)
MDVAVIGALAATGRGRRALHQISRAHVWVYRLTGRRRFARLGGAPVLLLTTIGRRSLLPRTVPVVYLPGEEPVLVGSNAGSIAHPLWFQNLVADPRAQVEVGRRRWEAEARFVEGAERDRLWPELVAAFPAYADYQRTTQRALPLVRLRCGPQSRDIAHEDTSWEWERALAYPCDGFVHEQGDAYFRAIEVAAPAAVVFRWLCQLRAAPYSYDAIDNFGRRSPRTLTPGLERLEPGQRFMTIFDLVDFDAPRQLTLAVRRLRPIFGEGAVTYRVTPGGPDRCRLTLKIVVGRSQARAEPLRRLLLPWLDLAMSRKQLRTIKELAERRPHDCTVR